MSAWVSGRTRWSMSRDEEGHRTYEITHDIYTSDPEDGPGTVMVASGLPSVGDYWAVGNDNDPWALCYPTLKINPRVDREKNQYWEATNTFSTKPLKRCNTTSIDDPLLEPDRISGSFINYTKEVRWDKDGDIIESSSHEALHGPMVEFDHNRATVRIERNLAALPLSTYAAMVNTVNDALLWGMAARCVKLSNVSWSRQYYGLCNVYYTVTYEFDIDANTFDRVAMDEGTKALHGEMVNGAWQVTDVADGVAADPGNPNHFVRATDQNGNVMRVILNGSGVPVTDPALAGSITVQYYSESNFLLLGVPTSL